MSFFRFILIPRKLLKFLNEYLEKGRYNENWRCAEEDWLIKGIFQMKYSRK
jgi:hypothetical protein